MENENIAGAAVNVQQMNVRSQIGIAVLKQSTDAQASVGDSIASSVSRVGDVIDPGQAVTQTGRLLDQSA